MRNSEWYDWKWQLKNRFMTLEELEKVINLTNEEKEAISQVDFPMSITPYLVSLIDKDNPNCPIRKQSIPSMDELCISPYDMEDPLDEDNDSPVPLLVHRYPDRVLLMATESCASYCRHCTRRRRIGYNRNEDLSRAYEYIKSNKRIRDVLISGGDPLILDDDSLEDIVRSIREIDHVEMIRIGTRVPVTMPMRITDQLIYTLKKYSPIWFSIHFNHPKEITREVKYACNKLAEHGFPLGSQTVLLKGINDNAYTMKKLLCELLKIRVRPYYLYHCDQAKGISHFRVPLSQGLEIIKKLRGHISGYAIPTYVIDMPKGGGKIPLIPEYVTKINDSYLLQNYKGETYMYSDNEENELKSDLGGTLRHVSGAPR